MKLFVYLLSCVLLISFGSLFVLKEPHGSTWLSFDDFTSETNIVDKIKAFKTDIVNKAKSLMSVESDPSTIYKWKDDKGVSHYSDKKIYKDNHLSEVWSVPNNLTVIPAEIPFVKIKPKVKNENIPEKKKPTKTNKINKLINDTKGVQTLMDQRKQSIDDKL